jgi:putative membrane protein
MPDDHTPGPGAGASADQERLAVDRTDLAEDRTVLANERTFASWCRTGLGSVGIGLAFHVLFLRMEPTWVPRAIATVFLAIGIYIFISAERRACVVLDRLSTHRVTPARDHGLKVIAYASSLAVLALIGALWLLPM